MHDSGATRVVADVSPPTTDAQLARDPTATPEAPTTSGTVVLVARLGGLTR
ncbi:hypothetical protein [Umezawaea beigongshangensis]|uniref:hypothetical protein n=1 Tax=Umezawaea beigongshangensis TaxID=2780383 RepID=UPI0018F20C02|nr:hypothetical protein [Umezawaea beigongshangensis]